MRRGSFLPVCMLFAVSCAWPAWLKAPSRGGSGGGEPGPVEAVSLRGEPLRRPPQPAEFRQQQEELLAAARAALDAEPDNVDELIWVGRRTAYLGRYQEAIAIYDDGIERHRQAIEAAAGPSGSGVELAADHLARLQLAAARLYRHRGHRRITIRRLTEAIADLERAAELVADQPDQVEPDGLPNAAGIPTSTLQSNIWYHLGLARYLGGDFGGAAAVYERCCGAATSSDMFVACSYWRYLALRRAGKRRQAARVLGPISNELELLENHEYQRLLLMFKGHLRPQDLLAAARDQGGVGHATLAHGVGVWHLLSAETALACEIFEEIVAGAEWPAFGHIAAEAELTRPECASAS